jgi:hypothetical protein
MSPPERAWELVLRHRDFYGASQHHTERMAYGVTTLYLTGTSEEAHLELPQDERRRHRRNRDHRGREGPTVA